ncbi:uncharacterized protein LOC17887927 isoform X1 [Capsella rubella]|uniref:uncharacterized protein LOC17887927 isoform X1 n=1 Tax=Capsella rubella TaxID=81985 RepID=UPI000CD5BA2A|nr:uncharacterized protein LOC17887927 isoform X1 [Capsella rubella]
MTTMMIDPVKRICDELGVRMEEAICYLDGFQWNLDSAMEACRSQSLPLSSLGFESSPVNENSSSMAPSTPPIVNPPEEQSRDECITRFLDAAPGTSSEDAYAYLSRSNWVIDQAVGYFYEECRPTAAEQMSNPKPLRSAPASKYKPLKIGSSSSGSKEVDSTGEHIPEAIPLVASSQVKIQNIQESSSVCPPMENWVDRACDDTNVYREEALYYLEGFKWKSDPAMEACRSKILPELPVSQESAEAPSNSPDQQSQLDELISQFRSVADGASREQAIYTLQICNWDVTQAIGCYMDGFSKDEDDISAAIAMSLEENRGLPLSSTGLPSQSQFEASLGYWNEGEIGSTSSSMGVDSTESERSLEEAGEVNSALAIPGMVSSQVDGKAVEEDSSTETFRDPVDIQDRIILGPRAARTSVTITINLADGRSVDIPFRPNQTVRDIRDAIDELTPEDDRDYFLQSMAGVYYMGPNITVHEISTGRSTTLLQLYYAP